MNLFLGAGAFKWSLIQFRYFISLRIGGKKKQNCGLMHFIPQRLEKAERVYHDSQ